MRQSWDEIKKLYPDQRVAIVDFESDKYDRITCGVVVAHGKSISDFPPPPTNRGMIALRYTGKSTLGDRRIPLRYP